MVKQNMKRLLALALSILMLTGTVTEWLPTALAVAEPAAVSETASPLEPETPVEDAGEEAALAAATPTDPNFQDPANGRPNLYVHFLGDNYGHGKSQNKTPGIIQTPDNYDRDTRTNPNTNAPGMTNTWQGYTVAEVSDARADNIIFWVGVGVDRKQVWELLKDGKGVTSLELGFYYNNEFIEPYVPDGSDFATVIENANLNGSVTGYNQWGDHYKVVHAEYDLPVEDAAANILRADPVTQEVMRNPSLDTIRKGGHADNKPSDTLTAQWKTTYISLELKDPSAARRFDGAYEGYQKDGDGNVVIPPAASGTTGPDYLLMIPFKVHKFDYDRNLCLRLIRDASHFSIGGGNDGAGDETPGATYAAWERVTTRNPGKDLKLQLRFAGDLNIWAESKPEDYEDPFLRATLQIINGGGAENTAKLSVQGDPGGVPVFVDTHNQTIQNLQGGTGMQLDLTVQNGYKAVVEVFSDHAGVEYHHTYTTLPATAPNEKYTFVMPQEDVIVRVWFRADNLRDFTVYLSEIPKPEAAVVSGNETTITSKLDTSDVHLTPPAPNLKTVSINSFDPKENHPTTGNDNHGPGPKMLVSKDQVVTVDVETHPDYEAIVAIKNFSTNTNLSSVTSRPANSTQDATTGEMTLPTGGRITFTMQATDLDVIVTYKEAQRHKATLEVWHEGDAPVLDRNTAQLAYLSYDAAANVSTARSGQVYEDNTVSPVNHSAVKSPSKKLPWVPVSAAKDSGSLGGDTGRHGKAWKPADAVAPATKPGPEGTVSLMAVLANLAPSTTEAAFATRFTAQDLMEADLNGTLTGLRKNLDGEPFGDDDLRAMAGYLLEIRNKILADTTPTIGLTALYQKEGDSSPTTTYKYFDLTPAQVQAYIIDCLEIDNIRRANEAAYRQAYQKYQQVKVIYDQVAAVAVTAMAEAPIAPEKPQDLLVTTSTGKREYQDATYQTDYIAKYDAYVTAYSAFITDLLTPTSLDPNDLVYTNNTPAHPTPVALPARVTVPLETAAAAQTKVNQVITGHGWDQPDLPADPAPTATIETREDRTVWIVMEADSGYELDHIELLDKTSLTPLPNDAGTANLQATASTSYENIYSFNMPKKDCVVRVFYRERAQRNLQWKVRTSGGSANEENTVKLEVFQKTTTLAPGPAPDSTKEPPVWPNVYPDSLTKPTLARRGNTGEKRETKTGGYPADADVNTPAYRVENTLTGSWVTIEVGCHKDYKVSVTATLGGGGTPINVNAPTGGGAGTYTFMIPSRRVGETNLQDVVLTVTYSPKSQKLYNAHIVMVREGAYSSTLNNGFWSNGNRQIAANSGTALSGSIVLDKGFYIYASYAVGASGSYNYTLSGNGYNNGKGAGGASGKPAVALHTTMPNEDLYVYIVVRKGLPPQEPGIALTLTLIDDSNTDATKADNWAKATVYKGYSTAPADVRGTLAAVGLGASSADKVLQRTYYGDPDAGTALKAGDRVVVDLSTELDKHYYVDRVDLEPTHLGGDMKWTAASDITTGERQFEFVMPNGSTNAIIHVKKKDSTTPVPTYYLYAQKSEVDKNGNITENPDNKITLAKSQTIDGYTSGAGYTLNNLTNPERVPGTNQSEAAARAGEKVTMTFEVDSGWYVQSVAVLTDGTARPADMTVLSGDNVGGGGKLQASFVMPTGTAWFQVKYRECPDTPSGMPEIPEYALTLVVIDNDNTGTPKDTNQVTADIKGYSGMLHPSITAGEPGEYSAVQYLHAGDEVTLTEKLAPGYVMDYMIINPTSLGLYPTYIDTNKATFTMPQSNIAVIAKVVKKTQAQQYTANLILRPPAGMSYTDINKVGQGTFTNGGGTLTDYDKDAVYSLLLTPGEAVNYDLFAFDGYYIKAVTVEPSLGAETSLTGAFGYQSGGLVMPAADVHVNVWFEKGWPDEVRYDLTLKVKDAARLAENYAYFSTVDGRPFDPADQTQVRGGQSFTIADKVKDGQEVQVKLNWADNYYVKMNEIDIRDSQGNQIPFRLTADGPAFAMPPRSTTVEIVYHKDTRDPDTENPLRDVYLHIDGRPNKGEVIKVSRPGGTPSDSAIVDGGRIANVKSGTVVTLDISGVPDTHRVVSVYAQDNVDGALYMLPMTQLTKDGGANSFRMPAWPEGVTVPTPFDPVANAVHVYVKLEEKTNTITDRRQTMNLVVKGPENSGTATLYETAKAPAKTIGEILDTAPANSTGAIAAGAVPAYILADQGDHLVVTMAPNPGYVLSQVQVTDSVGNTVSYDWISLLKTDNDDPNDWYKNPQQQIYLTTPATGGTVTVIYEEIPTVTPPPTPTDPDPDPVPKKYTAQVVVNNSEWPGTGVGGKNDAKLNDETHDPANPSALLWMKKLEAEPGQWLDLKIVVEAGYRILPVFVSPQSFGIQPNLYLGDLKSQITGFTMPAGDVTVYVHFVKDGLPTYDATLVVEGFESGVVTDGLNANHGDIHSDRVGTKGPIDPSMSPVSVQAAQGEWVTVTYDWDNASTWVKSLTVKDRSGRNVPFTQVDEHTVTLPMVARNIVITVTFGDRTTDPPEPEPEDPNPTWSIVRLHVIDLTTGKEIDTEADGWAQVTHDGTTATGDGSTNAIEDTGKVTALPHDPATESDDAWGNTKTIWVPAGRVATVNAFSDQSKDYYIHSAYVLYRDGGQMISCNLTPNQTQPDDSCGDAAHAASPEAGFYYHRSAEFRVHPDFNDVYVFLTDFDGQVPDETRYAATLMLKGPTEDTASAAAIWTGADLETDYTAKDTVTVNGNHGHIIVPRKEEVKVTVSPADGYDIDYILMTPLGIPITPTRVGKTYTFTMPGYNVSVCVYLKKSNEKQYKATLHYAQQQKDPNDPVGNNWAKISWDSQGAVDPDDTKVDLTTPGTAAQPNDHQSTIEVKEKATVTLDVSLDDPYVVLAAYVLQAGRMVPLAPALEGKGEVNSQTDPTKVDCAASFTMPAGDVDVYVVTTNDPPTGVWHTAVLTVRNPDNDPSTHGTITRDNSIDGTVNALPAPSSQDVNGSMNQRFVTVREGQKVDVRIYDDAPNYYFDRPAVLTHSGSYTGALTTGSVSGAQYPYSFTVGPCNSAVVADFKKQNAKKNPLTVVIEDPDNPSNGTVEQKLNVTAGTLAPLDLTSTDSNGVYQVIPDVEEDTAVNFTATAQPGYKVYAYWSYGAAGEETKVPVELTLGAGNTYTNTTALKMPATAAQLTVTYYKTYNATIIIHDRSTRDQSTTATLAADYPVEQTFPAGTVTWEQMGKVTVGQTLVNTQTIRELGTGTRLTTTVALNDTSISEIVAIVVTDATGTHFAKVEDIPQEGGTTKPGCIWNIDQSDVTVTVIVDDKDRSDDEKIYIAAVTTVGKPAGAAAPTILAVPEPDGPETRKGSIWTSANAGVNIQVTVPDVPGYTVTVTAVNQKDDTAVAMTQDGTDPELYTGSMPAANLLVTVTYAKVPRLTLHVSESAKLKALANKNINSVVGLDPTNPPSGTFDLTLHGDIHLATAGDTITVTATPTADTVPVTDVNGTEHQVPVIVEQITYYTASETHVLYRNTTNTTGPRTETFPMPAKDTTVVIRYAAKLDGIVIPSDDPDGALYTAWVAVEDPDNQPENRVDLLRNVAHPSDYPQFSPYWACGKPGDEMKLSISVKSGYKVKVTARKGDPVTGDFIPVIRQGGGSWRTAAANIPTPGEDIFFTVTFTKIDPDDPKPDPDEKMVPVTLVLVGHGGEAGNQGQVTGGSLSDLKTNGDTGTHVVAADKESNVHVTKKEMLVGKELRLNANWASGYKIIKATVSLPKNDTVVDPDPDDPAIFPEGAPDDGNYVSTELPLSRYGSSATARLTLPGEGAIVAVYYEDIYTVTLNVYGTTHSADPAAGDTISTTDDRANTITSTGSDPIHNHKDRLEELVGGETVNTQAIANTPVTGNRLVGVVYESNSTGARATDHDTTSPNNDYDFEMPQDDVQLYAVFEPEPEDPKDRSYIAKVALDDDSLPATGGNDITITNTTNTSASKGKFWTAAKHNDTVEIKVSLAPNTQAVITSAKMDDPAKWPDPTWANPGPDPAFHYYVNRTVFVVTDKTATFSMPADTDATVTVKFVKGYDLKLEVTDATNLATDAEPHSATVTYDSTKTIEWVNDGANKTYTPTNQTLEKVDGGKAVTTAIALPDKSPDPAYPIKATVTRRTPFTGTVTLTNKTDNYKYNMPGENTVESVLLRAANDPNQLLAKVQLAGESDINGNTATPIIDKDKTATDYTTATGGTVSGTVWTTTAGARRIQLTLTVAKGYMAKIKVLRDDSIDPAKPEDKTNWVFLDAKTYNFKADPATGDTDDITEYNTPTTSVGTTEITMGYRDTLPATDVLHTAISGSQYFSFDMPANRTATGNPGDANYDPGDTETDVTVIVEFVYAGTIPAPHDPRNLDMVNIELKEGFIYGEGRGDYAIIDVPTLIQGTELFNTDNYGGRKVNPTPPPAQTYDEPNKTVKFRFFTYNPDNDTYTELEQGKDILLEPLDADNLRYPGEPYNYYQFDWGEDADGDGKLDDNYVGSKFKLTLAPQSGTSSAQYQQLQGYLNSAGTLTDYPETDPDTGEVTKHHYRTGLYIMAENAIGEQSAYTQVWIRPTLSLAARVISYGPKHPMSATLHQLMTYEELNEGNLTGPHANPIPVDNFKFDHYHRTPLLEDGIPAVVSGTDKWQQVLRMRSSELLGDWRTGWTMADGTTVVPARDTNYDPDPAKLLAQGSSPTYALQIKKAANLTYTRVNMALNNDTVNNGGYYNADTHTYAVQDIINLVAGDVDQNEAVKFQDQDMLLNFLYRNARWTRVTAKPVEPELPDGYATMDPTDPAKLAYDAAKAQYDKDAADWPLSIYNPNSMPYRCDLNSDWTISVADWNIILARANYNHTTDDYLVDDGHGNLVLPNGMGDPPATGAVLLSLADWEEARLAADEYWDVPLTPEEMEALGDETFGGETVNSTAPVETGEPDHPAPAEPEPTVPVLPDLRPETPEGEEALNRQEQAILPEEEILVLPQDSEEEPPQPEPDPEPEDMVPEIPIE